MLLHSFLKKILIWGAIAPLFCFGQENLVKNSDFESFGKCPSQVNNIEDCIDYWKYDQFGTPDYANQCATAFVPSLYTIPNAAGFQAPYSGQGYTHSVQFGISYPRDFTYNDPPFENVQFRESFGGSFTKPLEKGIHYIEFFVSFADYGKTGAYPDGRVATNAFDLILLEDSSSIYNSVSPYINLNDVIKVHDEQTVINDTINWVKLSTCFNAKGGETFFALGAFRDTSEIIVEFSGHSNFNIYHAYYFYDNIKIYECPTCCPYEFPTEEQVNVFSNPSTQNNPASLQMWLFPNTSGDLTIYDSAGRLIASKKYSDLLNTFIFENFASGMYHYKFKTSDGIENYGKILVQ